MNLEGPIRCHYNKLVARSTSARGKMYSLGALSQPPRFATERMRFNGFRIRQCGSRAPMYEDDNRARLSMFQHGYLYNILYCRLAVQPPLS